MANWCSNWLICCEFVHVSLALVIVRTVDFCEEVGLRIKKQHDRKILSHGLPIWKTKLALLDLA